MSRTINISNDIICDMCGRYQFDFSDSREFKKRFKIKNETLFRNIKTTYNASPGQKLPVILSKSPNSVHIMRWGLVPYWEKTIQPKGLINIRDETILEKSWVKQYICFQRCLVPASGFYEWKRTNDGKSPYFIHIKKIKYFSFAGLYSEWENPNTKEKINTFAIITTSPNQHISSIHNRMPVILDEKNEENWLNPDNIEIDYFKDFLRPFKGDLEVFEISKRINNPIYNDPDIIKPIKN